MSGQGLGLVNRRLIAFNGRLRNFLLIHKQDKSDFGARFTVQRKIILLLKEFWKEKTKLQKEKKKQKSQLILNQEELELTSSLIGLLIILFMANG